MLVLFRSINVPGEILTAKYQLVSRSFHVQIDVFCLAKDVY